MNIELQGEISNKASMSKESASSLNNVLGRKNSEISLLKNEHSSMQSQVELLTA